MKILVTGGLGFIGSNFIREMLSGNPDCEIINLDLVTYAGNPENLRDIENDPRYTFVQGDICDVAIVSRIFSDHRVDAVVHFAAESHVDRSISDASVFVRTNVLGTHVLLEGALKNGISRFIHVSTDEVYGSTFEGSFTELDNLNPSSPYSASKAGSDLLARSYWITHGLPVIITRCTNNFGPYQYPEKLIPLFATNLFDGKKVPVYGTGKNVRDWIYVIDHCRAIAFILSRGAPGEIYNIGSGNELTNLEITHSLLAHSGRDESRIEYVQDRPGHDWRYSLDTTKIRSMGWRPVFDFETAMEMTVSWYAENEWWWRPLKQ
ncbi:MAG: dTDP-glucose 4,6-dehydratase [Methanocalculus sp.]|uniref:dTDP-glucose 4,6-dehydratase n=1 Tax=Methanocalculus sp. TaxID=2004547 RepID=UPI0027199284|nr:dTDP-glucose 4,6-dehydratase [Methanocalculus sp.]MDO9538547.1 dTDP-glucose 4,6-dehydratase [Methanocalculus sp.]